MAHRFNPQAVQSVAGPYYSRLITAPDTARSRGQVAYTIAGGVAAILVGVAALSQLSTLPPWVRACALLAIVAWALVAALFVGAVSLPVMEIRRGTVHGADTFVDEAIGRAREERARVDKRVRLAALSALIPLALTIITLSGFAFAGSQTVEADVALTSDGARSLQTICPSGQPVLHGRVVPSATTATVVALNLPAGACGNGPVTLSLQRTDIAALRTRATACDLRSSNGWRVCLFGG